MKIYHEKIQIGMYNEDLQWKNSMAKLFEN